MKTYDIINSEGAILKLEFKNISNIKLISALNDGSGRVAYETDIINLMLYLKSMLTLQELAIKSINQEFVLFDFNTKKKALINKANVIKKISCGSDLFCSLPIGMGIYGKKYDKMILNFFNDEYE
jgi:hypothetical protein